MEPKEKLMSFVYYMKGQIPPHNKADYKKNWKKVVEGLQKQYPAPTEAIYKKRLNEAVLSGKSLLTENVRQKRSFPKFTKKEIKEMRRGAGIKARCDEYVNRKAALLERKIMATPSNKLKLQESSYSELKFGVSKVLNESNQHVGNKVSLIYEGKRYDVDKLPKRKMLEAYINNRCNILMEGGELQPFMEQWWRIDKHIGNAAKKVGGAIKKGANYVKKNVIDPGVAKVKQVASDVGSAVKNTAQKVGQGIKKGAQAVGGAVKKYGGKALDIGQDVLSVAGMIPIVGNAFDAVNTGISGARAAFTTGDARKKHLMNMGLNAAAMIPGAGLAVGGAKLAGKILPKAIQKGGSAITKGLAGAGKTVTNTLGQGVAAIPGVKSLVRGASKVGPDGAVKGIDNMYASSGLGGAINKKLGDMGIAHGHVIPSMRSMNPFKNPIGAMAGGATATPRAIGDHIGGGIATKFSKKIIPKGGKSAGFFGTDEEGNSSMFMSKPGKAFGNAVWDASTFIPRQIAKVPGAVQQGIENMQNMQAPSQEDWFRGTTGYGGPMG